MSNNESIINLSNPNTSNSKNIKNKKVKDKSKDSSSFLNKKRKIIFNVQEKIDKDDLNNLIDFKNKIEEKERFCKVCKCKLYSEIQKIFKNYTFKENENLNDSKKKELNEMKATLFRVIKTKIFPYYCDLCLKNIFIKEGITNFQLLNEEGAFNFLDSDLEKLKNLIEDNSNYEEEIEELKSCFQENKDIEDKINEIYSNLINLPKEKINEELNKKSFNKVKILLEKNIKDLKKANNSFEKLLENINNLKTQEKNKSLNIININYKISDKNIITFNSMSNTRKYIPKKYIILTKGFIYESKNQNIEKDKLTKNYHFNSINEFDYFFSNSQSPIYKNNKTLNNEIKIYLNK